VPYVTTAIAAKRKILLVDDEAALVHSLRYNLEKTGYAVTTAGDGRTAVTLAPTEQPDLVVLDIMLPGRDGLSVLRQLRAQQNRTPVLLLSARGQVDERVEGLNAGADVDAERTYRAHAPGNIRRC